MDNFVHCPPSSFSQPKGWMMEELRQTLVTAQMELESTRQRAEEEMRNRDNQLTHLKFLLSQANLEKQESGRTLQRLLSDKFILQHKIRQLQHHKPGINLDLDYRQELALRRRPRLDSHMTHKNNNIVINGFSDSSDESSIVSNSPEEEEEEEDGLSRLVLDQPLPEKGKLLVAVMKAGPLLQTLMLAGPLPQWRHPPPPLDSYQIPAPPLAIPPDHLSDKNDHQEHRVKLLIRKRELCGGGGGSEFGQNKHPRFVL